MIRAALAMELKHLMGTEMIREREEELVRKSVGGTLRHTPACIYLHLILKRGWEQYLFMSTVCITTWLSSS